MGLVNVLTEKQAWELASAARELLIKDGKPGSICVVGKYGNVIIKVVMDDAKANTSRIAEFKARNAGRTGHTTREIRDMIAKGEVPLNVLGVEESEFIPWAGGVPVFENGVLIGGIGVSNLTEDEDEKYCMDAIKACGLSYSK